MARQCFAVVLLIASAPSVHAGAQPPAAEFFEARVRPLLVEHCFRCHGPKKQQAGLRLDSRKGMLQGGESGAVLVPGNPDKSLLVQAVKHQGEAKMPPGKKLSAQEIEILAAWIKQGAPWPESKSVASADPDAWKKHWAFQPVGNPPIPDNKGEAWPQTSVDRFILARLKESGLKPSPTADPRTLIRRVTFDLIGLPPTPEEVDEFLADCRLQKADLNANSEIVNLQIAFTKVVDRLLASPHYGERWGRHWLDVARYADTKGYVFFEEAQYHWAYTYRDYVIRAFNEDLPYDRFILEQLAADQLPLKEDKRSLTALGFLTVGGRFMNNQHDILDDRIDVVTRGLMGLTVTCARCHDHKYDPISSKDYYSLYGVFASCAEPTVLPLFQPPPRTEEYAKYDKELKVREKKLTDFVRAKHDELVSKARSRAAEYLLAAHALRDQPNTDEFMLLADTNDLNPTMIVRWKNYLDRRAKKHDPVFAPWFAFAALAKKDFVKQAAEVTARLKADDPQKPLNPLVASLFQEKPPQSMKEVAQRYGAVCNEIYLRWEALALFGIVLSPSAAEQQILDVFRAPDAPANVAMLPYGDLSLLPDRASQAKLQELRKALESWRATGAGAPPRAMVLEDLPTPYAPRVFLRGNPGSLGEAVARQMPMVVGGAKRKPFQEGSGRLEFARAIASRDNPLTARVLVNRVWRQHFGEGLVSTPSDFGLRSDPPSHPELLDHLATWFMDNGWSIKKLHRLILLSRVYQQRSDERPECAKIDSENRLLWKMNRRRLEFEATRDALLFVTGRMNTTIGGPSVANSLEPAGNRRTLYSHLDRLNVPGLFRTFDYPNPDATSPQRDVTTVAPQALFLMNHPFVIGCAKNLAARPEIANEKDVARKIERLYRLLYGRSPTTEELALGREYVAAGNHPAAWERYAHALMLANEFVMVD